MKKVNGLCLLLGLLLIVSSCAAKPDCHALVSWLEVATGSSCGERRYSSYDFDCSIDGCNAALSDPCWYKACEDGRFHKSKWAALVAGWKDEEWTAHTKKYGWKMREGCDSRALRCIPVEQTVDFADRNLAPFSCCVAVCDEWKHELYFHAPLSNHLKETGICDFSAGGSVGFVKWTRLQYLDEEQKQ